MNTDFQNSDEYKKIFLFQETIADRIISRESGWLEFKEYFNWNSKDKYSKSMLSFANNKGEVFGLINKIIPDFLSIVQLTKIINCAKFKV